MKASIRLRLALVHTILFALMAVVLVSGIYVLTAGSTDARSSEPRTRVERELGLPAGTLAGLPDLREQPPSPTSSLPDRRTLGQVASGVQEQTRSALLSTLIVFSGALVIATTIVTFVVGWHVAGRSLRPLRRITARAKTLSERDLSEPIVLDGPRDELHELADTFNQMLARLDHAFAGQRLFAANASHELRTPLTRIRAKLDVTMANPKADRDDLEEMANAIRDAVDRCADLIDALLALARAQGEPQRQSVPLDDLSRVVLDDLQDDLARRGLSLRSTLAECVVSGDPVLLEHLVRNVIGNAVTHNTDGGWVEVRTGSNGMARLHVANSGRVIPQTSVDELFVPLHRSDADRMHVPEQGFGLGLAIVRAVAEAHHGWVRAEPIREGGLAIDVTLPPFTQALPGPP